VQHSQRATGKFQQRNGRIFRFDFVQQRSRTRLYALHVPKQPQQQIYGVNPLIDQRAAAIESPRPAPTELP